MPGYHPTDICPAYACAADVMRLEAEIERTARLIDEAQRDRAHGVLRDLETVLDDLIFAADAARNRLARADALSSAGAIAQLFAAIRDVRVQDDDERDRAKDLEARAIRMLEASGLADRRTCRALSQSKLTRRLGPCPLPAQGVYPASRAISASEIS